MLLTTAVVVPLVAAAAVCVWNLTRPHPPAPPLAANLTRLHRAVTTTVFWVGEPADSDNGYIANQASAWDDAWQQHFGGTDAPGSRQGFQPAGFTPRENPFYAALPYSDIADNGVRKSSARYCRALQPHPDARYSYCKNIWLAISAGGKTVYAQWEDAGPFGEDDTAYVFGTSKPRNITGVGAGLDVSPAVSSYLGFEDVGKTTWHFVRATDVPSGPWKQTITVTPGDSL